MKHIAICDDERAITRMVASFLEDRGYRCTPFGDVDSLLDAVRKDAPDLILLDIRMPEKDGLAGLRDLRAISSIPVIFMTALAEPIDRVVGLELGADDYLVKPVDLRELEARIKVVLRRMATTQSPENGNLGRVTLGPCTLDLDAAQLIGPDGNQIEITAMEFALLKVFHDHAGRVLSRDQLLDLAHDRSWDPFDRSIDLRISRLRKKIEPNPSEPVIIRTVRGMGYVMHK